MSTTLINRYFTHYCWSWTTTTIAGLLVTFTLPLRHSPHFTRLTRASTTSDRLWQRFGTWLQVLPHLLRRLTFIRQRNEFLPARHQARLSVDRYTVHFLLIYAPIYPALKPRRVSLLHRRIEANKVGTLSKWRKRNKSSCLLRNALEKSVGTQSVTQMKNSDRWVVTALSTQMRRQHLRKLWLDSTAIQRYLSFFFSVIVCWIQMLRKCVCVRQNPEKKPFET